MILRSKRHRILLGFALGFFICLILSGLGFYYYLITEGELSQQKIDEIKKIAVEEYAKSNPTSLIYLFSTDKKAGELLVDTDFSAAEIGAEYVPVDAITDISDIMGKVIRCDVKKNTCATFSLIFDQGDYPDDLRLMEYTVINLPEKLESRQFIDIRISFPNGLDYIVLSKKEVVDLNQSDDGKPGTVWIHSDEEEILRLSSAIVDASIIEGAYIYAVPYVAPDIQNEAHKTYPVNMHVYDLIVQNPNIINKAVIELENRNRELFEQLINQNLQNTGKNEVYFKNDASVSTHSYQQSESQNGASDNGMDGRL